MFSNKILNSIFCAVNIVFVITGTFGGFPSAFHSLSSLAVEAEWLKDDKFIIKYLLVVGVLCCPSRGTFDSVSVHPDDESFNNELGEAQNKPKHHENWRS